MIGSAATPPASALNDGLRVGLRQDRITTGVTNNPHLGVMSTHHAYIPKHATHSVRLIFSWPMSTSHA
jgi:hypothetical protein